LKKRLPISRHLRGVIEADLDDKMVFVSGPRQCGKTTLARQILADRSGAYFSYDVDAHRALLRAQALPASAGLWVFDELHKMRTWRRWLKGVYDLHGDDHAILVTGSGRLDAYDRGGESLQGRYLHHRMHPLTVRELVAPALDPEDVVSSVEHLDGAVPAGAAETLDGLLRLGGFPEPLMSGSERRAGRWRRGYGSRLVREEVRDLETVRDLDKLELLFERLSATVGSVLSINALREDLEVAFETVRTWISVFERLYAVYRVPPFGAPRIKAVKKEQKLYFWDWARAGGEAARFENLVLSHLLRLVHFLEDTLGEHAELRYFRDSLGREVDAIVLRNRRPWLAVEVKLDDRPLDASLRYLLERVRIPYAFQVSLRGQVDSRVPDIGGARVRIVPAARFLAHLP
jgi:uncharacterized protein